MTLINRRDSFLSFNLLVVEDNIRQPDVLGRDVELGDSAVLARVPPELVIHPLLKYDPIRISKTPFYE